MGRIEGNMDDKNVLRRGQKFYLAIRRFLDIIFSGLGLILISWFLLIIALLIKCTSKGPVFFRQERVGKNKKIFRIFKFRTMRADAPEIAPSEMSEEEQKAMEYGFGNFLRKFSIDELPQLINIFLGHMSFIGPRPGAAHNEEELIKLREEHHPSAFLVRPGLSGYAQIKMHRDHDPLKKAELDSYYVAHCNFFFDTKLFFQTLFSIFSRNKGK